MGLDRLASLFTTLKKKSKQKIPKNVPSKSFQRDCRETDFRDKHHETRITQSNI